MEIIGEPEGSAPLICLNCSAKKEKKEVSESEKTPRQILKEQIAQATAENEVSRSQNQTPQKENETANNQAS
jgi:hypothetical protein